MMPVWAGWLMALMGVVVGWLIGHQLGVQWEARRFRRDTEIVLHPTQPANHPASSIQRVMTPLEIGEEYAADMFAQGYTLEMKKPRLDALEMNKRRVISHLDDQSIDDEFVNGLDWAARAYAVHYLAEESSMGMGKDSDLTHVTDGLVMNIDDELMDLGMLVAHRVRGVRDSTTLRIKEG